MTKFVLLMIMCSGIPGNECKPIPTPINEFDKYHQCIIYGYDYSSELLKTFDTKSVDEYEMFTAFDCKEQSSI
jgi:hypothetical protein